MGIREPRAVGATGAARSTRVKVPGQATEGAGDLRDLRGRGFMEGHREAGGYLDCDG